MYVALKNKGEYLAPVNAFKPQVDLTAVRSKVMVLLLLMHCLLLLPLFVGDLCLSLFFNKVLFCNPLAEQESRLLYYNCLPDVL